jgi:hypothetical protein
MNKAREESTIQALAAVGALAGLALKKVTIGDDLKDYTLTLAFTGISSGHVQERFDFEREDTRPLVATVNGNGEVMDLHKDTDPSDLTAKDETQAKIETDPDQPKDEAADKVVELSGKKKS